MRLEDNSGVEISGFVGCTGGVFYECGEKACFARESTHVCRLLAPGATAAAAYDDCFGITGSAGVAEKVLMSSLSAGDRVLSSKDEVAQVIVNQHAAVSIYTQMHHIKHSAGYIELSPDHVLSVDGKLAPAREAVVGSQLEGGTVEAVSYSTDAVINPLTTSGRILAAGAEGLPIVATHAPEWLAAFMLSDAGLLLTKYSLSTTLAATFPQAVQAFYNQHLEARFSANHAGLEAVVQAVPTPILFAVVAAFDGAIATAFLASNFGTTLLAIAALALAARKARKA